MTCISYKFLFKITYCKRGNQISIIIKKWWVHNVYKKGTQPTCP